jgi:hypothetical protein
VAEEQACGPRRYWPFAVVQPEQHREEMRFLETAYREGYAPYLEGAGDFGAGAAERSGLIVVRGRKRWEVILGAMDAKIASAFVDDFRCASDAVLQWLRGTEIAEILAQVQNHLVLMPGGSHSFVLDAVPKNPALLDDSVDS